MDKDLKGMNFIAKQMLLFYNQLTSKDKEHFMIEHSEFTVNELIKAMELEKQDASH